MVGLKRGWGLRMLAFLLASGVVLCGRAGSAEAAAVASWGLVIEPVPASAPSVTWVDRELEPSRSGSFVDSTKGRMSGSSDVVSGMWEDGSPASVLVRAILRAKSCLCAGLHWVLSDATPFRAGSGAPVHPIAPLPSTLGLFVPGVIGLVTVALGRRARTAVWDVTNVTPAEGSVANPGATGSVLLLLSRDPELTHNLDQLLSGAGYATRSRSSVSDVLALADTIQPALVLVDRRVADWDVLRTSPGLSRVPFLGLVPDGFCLAEEEHVLDLERGLDGVHEMADGGRLLLAKVATYLRRAGHGGLKRGIYRVGAVELDSDRLQVTVAGVPVKLSAKHFALLEAFMQAPSKVFTRRELFDIVWGPNFAIGDHTLDVHIHAIRQALDRDPLRRCRLLAIKGVGFKLVEDSSAAAVPRLLPGTGGAVAPVRPARTVGLSQPRRLPPLHPRGRLRQPNPIAQTRRTRRLQPVAVRRTVEQAVPVG